jgi:type IV pilus assembly protein PilQ
MTATGIDRLAHGVRGLVAGCVVLAALAVACATTPGAPQEGAAAQPMTLNEVRVAKDADTTVVDLLGLTKPEYTDFRQETPARIVLDLEGVQPGPISDSVAVYDGTVQEVSLAATPAEEGRVRTRVELGLARDADYQVVDLGDRLQVRVTARAADEQASSAPETPAPAEASPAPAAVASTPAHELSQISAEPQAGGTVVRLVADGTIQAPQHFPLSDPERLVIDLPGLASSAPAKVEVGSEQVKRVRVGAHEGKVRVVIDGAAPGSLAGARLVPMGDGLAVAFGGAQVASDMGTAAAPAATASQAAASGSSRVLGVEFDAQADRERVAVLTSGDAPYSVMQPDPETYVLRFSDATIDPDAAIRVAPDKPGAVSLVTAFQQPDAKPSEVRVVVRRAKGLVPDVKREGSMLTLDFKHGGDVAAGLPMLTGDKTVAAMHAETPASADAASPASLADATGDQAIAMLKEGGMLNQKRYVGRRISLDFKEVQIADVLRLIADVSELNIIAGDEVKGEVTIRLVDVPWDQALDVILLTKGLGFVRVGNVLRIAPSDVLKAEDEARLQERRAKEKLEDLVVKLQPVNYGNVKEIAKMVSKLLSARGTVDIDARTNTLIIKDINSVIDEATSLVKAIDTQTPQVLIESKIVEAALDFSRELGSTWAFGAQPLVNGFDESSGQRTDLGGNDFKLHDNPLLTGVTDTFNHVTVSNPITSAANGLLDLGAFLLDDKLNIELRLEAAESNGEGKVISSPRVVTLDNRRATIEQGVSIPFQTFENGDAKLEFIDAVLKLDVTPHITADRSIIMKVEVKRNAPDDSVPTPTGSPAIAKNEATTETLVKDGQTLVIGGIYVIQTSQRSTGVPYLNAIPILGNAFKNNQDRDQRKELLVFVTPRIVVNPELAS